MKRATRYVCLPFSSILLDLQMLALCCSVCLIYSSSAGWWMSFSFDRGPFWLPTSLLLATKATFIQNATGTLAWHRKLNRSGLMCSVSACDGLSIFEILHESLVFCLLSASKQSNWQRSSGPLLCHLWSQIIQYTIHTSPSLAWSFANTAKYTLLTSAAQIFFCIALIFKSWNAAPPSPCLALKGWKGEGEYWKNSQRLDVPLVSPFTNDQTRVVLEFFNTLTACYFISSNPKGYRNVTVPLPSDGIAVRD